MIYIILYTQAKAEGEEGGGGQRKNEEIILVKKKNVLSSSIRSIDFFDTFIKFFLISKVIFLDCMYLLKY